MESRTTASAMLSEHPAHGQKPARPENPEPQPVPLSLEASRVLKNLEYIEEAWPLIVELRIPGTRPRWTQRSHRLLGSPGENSTVKGVASSADESAGPSSGASPVDLSLLDLLATLAATADDLAATLADVLGCGETAAALPSAWIDPRPHLRFVRANALRADARDPKTIPWIHDKLTSLTITVSAILGEARHGQTLAAVCPWCSGRSPATPLGGARTLVLRHPDPNAPDLHDARIVCTGTECAPPEAACTHRDPHGRPAWPWREWDWLATQLLPNPKRNS